MNLLDRPPKNLFFSGKGGVGKTSVACASAVHLAAMGRQVLLVSTDPASNLGQVLETHVGSDVTPIPAQPGLSAVNIDPVKSAERYRERVIAPLKGQLPQAALEAMEEQLSGACTTEIAGFDEFVKLLTGGDQLAAFDHVIFDTAPTGHTLRLLSLPAAWSGFLSGSHGEASCLGPLAGLDRQRSIYERSVAVLGDPAQTLFVLVSRARQSDLREAERTSRELRALGIGNQRMVLNAVLPSHVSEDAMVREMIGREQEALSVHAAFLNSLPVDRLPLQARNLIGVDRLRDFFSLTAPHSIRAGNSVARPAWSLEGTRTLRELIDTLVQTPNCTILTMGKGGVGKTSVAEAIAIGIARRGARVLLSTTDPAADVGRTIREDLPQLEIQRIDPIAETEGYRRDVLDTQGRDLDPASRSLLEEDLRSPCTEEISVFRAFARTLDRAKDAFVVLDTAPTGHTLLLLDASLRYHREISRLAGDVSEEVRQLLPRLRSAEKTRVLIVTLAEATPVQEALELQKELRRAGIEPYAWVLNQALSPCSTSDPLLRARQMEEARYLKQAAAAHPAALVVVPYLLKDLTGSAALSTMESLESAAGRLGGHEHER